MPIRWDSLLVRHLARELDEAFAGERLRALRLDGKAHDLALLFRNRTLLWRLHPERGWLGVDEALDPEAQDLRLRARVRRVLAPPDERLLRFELLPERSGRALDLVVELIGNAWNAIVIEAESEVIRHVLRSRERPRLQRVGAHYEPPPPTERLGAREELGVETWLDALSDAAPEDRAARLVRAVAWTSPLNANAILGPAALGGADEELRPAYRRWLELVRGAAPAPTLLLTERGPQPYPFALTGVTSRPTKSLLAAFREVARGAEAAGDAPAALTLSPQLLARLEGALRHHERRAARLRAELDGLENAEELRTIGDLILARYHQVPKGSTRATLPGFDGSEREVELDPALEPHENADRYYERAARSARARERLPGLIANADEMLARLEALRTRALAGEADGEEVEAALPERAARDTRSAAVQSLPYRTFRSSGGLEIRVGRGAGGNDDLTFRHSAPDDVWLHARYTAGAHVVLRWPGEGAPPARDLHQAAALAALHSKARTSGSVPVDWTYRKYVRKPKGAPPGSVVPDRVRTVFVEPDERLLETLADEDGGASR